MRLLVLAIVCWLGTQIGAQEKRTVTVEGTAETTVKPDLAILKIGIVATNQELATAKESVDANVAKVSEAIAACGINKDSIQRSKINIYTNDEQPESTTTPLFVIERNVETVTPINLIDTVLSAATKAGANRVYDITYSVSTKAEVSQVTLAKAIKNAKVQAKFLAESFDAKLGKVYRIQGDRGTYPAGLSLVVSAAQTGNENSSYVPETITISRSVDVVFELEDL